MWDLPLAGRRLYGYTPAPTARTGTPTLLTQPTTPHQRIQLPDLLLHPLLPLLSSSTHSPSPQWQRAIRLLELMWQIGGELCPDIVSYNTVIKACGNAGQVGGGSGCEEARVQQWAAVAVGGCSSGRQ